MDVVTLHVVPWADPLVEQRGFALRSDYVEYFWLPVLGPTTTLLLRRLSVELERSPDGVDLDLETTARSLGLGHGSGERAPLRRAIGRCVRFGAARLVGGESGLGVRRALAPLPDRHVQALPAPLRQQLLLVESTPAPRDQPATSVRR